MNFCCLFHLICFRYLFGLWFDSIPVGLEWVCRVGTWRTEKAPAPAVFFFFLLFGCRCCIGDGRSGNFDWNAADGSVWPSSGRAEQQIIAGSIVFSAAEEDEADGFGQFRQLRHLGQLQSVPKHHRFSRMVSAERRRRSGRSAPAALRQTVAGRPPSAAQLRRRDVAIDLPANQRAGGPAGRRRRRRHSQTERQSILDSLSGCRVVRLKTSLNWWWRRPVASPVRVSKKPLAPKRNRPWCPSPDPRRRRQTSRAEGRPAAAAAVRSIKSFASPPEEVNLPSWRAEASLRLPDSLIIDS